MNKKTNKVKSADVIEMPKKPAPPYHDNGCKVLYAPCTDVDGIYTINGAIEIMNKIKLNGFDLYGLAKTEQNPVVAKQMGKLVGKIYSLVANMRIELQGMVCGIKLEDK